MEDFSKHNTILLEALISSLTIIHAFTITSPAGTCLISPTQLVSLNDQIDKITKLKDYYVKQIEESNKALPSIIEQINSPE